jgi:ubiquinone/menaquinone biosynthesis C-methylase UbiE
MEPKTGAAMFHPQGPTFWELARQALSSTERGYDLLAPRFDFTPFRTPDVVLAAVANQIGEPRSVDAALDVCCGTGCAARAIRPLCRRRIVGVDFSQGMLDVARQFPLEADGFPNIEYVRANALDMPYSAEFDLAVTFGGLGHFLPGQQPVLIEQLAKALKPGGRLVFISSHMPTMRSIDYWLSRGFNAAMHVRNALLKPPFIMYYLTFLIPDATRMLSQCDFEVEIREGIFPRPFQRACLVVATKQPQ